LDVGLAGYLRYVGYGVMSYNLHVIGRELLARDWARAATVRRAA
jgi:tRNA(Glu) U13 pseudouridine synthase TruD